MATESTKEVPNGDDKGSRRHWPGPRHGGAFTTGLVLVLVGLALLIIQLSPNLHLWAGWERSWPLVVVGVGILVALIGFANAAPDALIGAAVVGGLGLLLHYQNTSGDWGSWAYAWSLIPGFAGVGMLLSGLYRLVLGRRWGRVMYDGVTNLIVSVLLFSVFGSFLGGPQWLGRYWPVGLIVLGVWILVRPGRLRRKDRL